MRLFADRGVRVAHWEELHWWEWIGGGLLGVAGVAVPVWAGSLIGMAAYFICNLLGQLVAACALQLISQRAPATLLQLLLTGAVVLGLIGSMLVQDRGDREMHATEMG